MLKINFQIQSINSKYKKSLKFWKKNIYSKIQNTLPDCFYCVHCINSLTTDDYFCIQSFNQIFIIYRENNYGFTRNYYNCDSFELKREIIPFLKELTLKIGYFNTISLSNGLQLLI